MSIATVLPGFCSSKSCKYYLVIAFCIMYVNTSRITRSHNSQLTTPRQSKTGELNIEGVITVWRDKGLSMMQERIDETICHLFLLLVHLRYCSRYSTVLDCRTVPFVMNLQPASTPFLTVHRLLLILTYCTYCIRHTSTRTAVMLSPLHTVVFTPYSLHEYSYSYLYKAS